LFTLTPSFARLREGARVREVPVEALAAGQIAEVRPGESFPADGAVYEGESMVDLGLLTGESRPVPLRVGDLVFSGAVDLSRVLQVSITATRRASRVGKLFALIEECSRRKAPIVLLADRIAGWFTVTAIGLFVVTLVVWLFLDAHRAVDHAVSLLIVSCPCGLGLATPFAVSVALGRAARAHIVVKGGEILERLVGKYASIQSSPAVLFLDKTGTLTDGQLTVIACCMTMKANPTLRPTTRIRSILPTASSSRSWLPCADDRGRVHRQGPPRFASAAFASPKRGVSRHVVGSACYPPRFVGS
jgi:P-type E1-E2 ATPase